MVLKHIEIDLLYKSIKIKRGVCMKKKVVSLIAVLFTVFFAFAQADLAPRQIISGVFTRNSDDILVFTARNISGVSLKIDASIRKADKTRIDFDQLVILPGNSMNIPANYWTPESGDTLYLELKYIENNGVEMSSSVYYSFDKDTGKLKTDQEITYRIPIPVSNSYNAYSSPAPSYTPPKHDNSAYIMMLRQQLKDAEDHESWCESNYRSAVHNNSGIFMAGQLLNQARQHVQQCQERLTEWENK
jgi:hypothetical protein